MSMVLPPVRRAVYVLPLILIASASGAEPRRQPYLFVVLIGGMDSDPTAEQISGKAPRGRGNSGMFQLQGDLKHSRVDAEYFNWNGTRAGKISQAKPPHAAAVCAVIRDRLQAHPRDRVAIVGNSWGGHTALDACRQLHDCDAPLRIDCVVFLDPSSAGRALLGPKELPVNVGSAVNFHTRNAFVWGRLDRPRLLNVDLGDRKNGFLVPGGPQYDAGFSFPAHVAAEWDQRIHQEIRRRVLDMAPGE